MPRLIVIKGADEGRQFELTGPMVGIGRDSGNAIRLHDTEVSRRHAELRLSLDGASYRLFDRNSANGVYVNGKPVHDAILQPGAYDGGTSPRARADFSRWSSPSSWPGNWARRAK